MTKISRRSALKAAVAAVPAIATLGVVSRAEAGLSARVTVAKRSAMRLYFESTMTRDNGKFRVRGYTQDPQTRRHNQFGIWGPFSTAKGYSKTVYVNPGTYGFDASGGGVNFTVRIETKPLGEGAEFTTAATLSGNLG